MDPAFLPSPSATKRDTSLDKKLKLTDTAILLRHYKFNELYPNSYEIGQGTPQGDPFSMRPRLVPVPRWLTPRPMSSFNMPQRQPCFYFRDPCKARNFRTLCWRHTDSSLLSKSPLNDTVHRAFMPARPKIPLRGSMFCLPRPRPSSSSLHAFGTILPGSTLQTYRLSTPLARDANGHIINAPKAPKPGPIPTPMPPPGVTGKISSYPSSDGAHVMVHRMNLARQKWNTPNIRARRLSRYIELASRIAPPTSSEGTGPILENLIDRIDGLCAYTKKMGTMERSESRHKEATTLVELRLSFHELLRSEQTSKLGGLSHQELNSSYEDPVIASMIGNDDNQQSYASRTPEPKPKVTLLSITGESTDMGPSTSTDTFASYSSSPGHGPTYALPVIATSHDLIALTKLAPITLTTRPVEGQLSPVSFEPQPRQKQRRPPVVPSTRILRSMSKVNPNNGSVPPAASPDTHGSRAVASPSARRQPRKESKPSQVPPASTNIFFAVPADSIQSRTRYNLRPQKRELGKDEASGRGNKQTSHPAKRRRV